MPPEHVQQSPILYYSTATTHATTLLQYSYYTCHYSITVQLLHMPLLYYSTATTHATTLLQYSYYTCHYSITVQLLHMPLLYYSTATTHATTLLQYSYYTCHYSITVQLLNMPKKPNHLKHYIVYHRHTAGKREWINLPQIHHGIELLEETGIRIVVRDGLCVEVD